MDYTRGVLGTTTGGGTLVATGVMGHWYIALALGVAILVILGAVSLRKFRPISK